MSATRLLVAKDNGDVESFDPTDGTSLGTFFSSGQDILDICLDRQGNAYVVGFVSGGKNVWKLRPNGTEVWSLTTGASAFGVAVDSSGNVFVAGAASGGKTLWKYDSSGNLLASFNTVDPPEVGGKCLFVDHLGFVYIAHTRGTSNLSLRKLSNDLNTELWTADAGSSGTAVIVPRQDTDRSVYLIHFDNLNEGCVIKYSTLGVQLDQFNPGLGTDGSISASANGTVLHVAQIDNVKQFTNGVEDWEYLSSFSVSLDVDLDGICYVTDGTTILALNSSGSTIWSKSMTGTGRALAVDDSQRTLNGGNVKRKKGSISLVL